MRYEKPRTYREVAWKDFLAFTKRRKPNKQQIRSAIRKQLQYARRNLDTIDGQIGQGAVLKGIEMDRIKAKQDDTTLTGRFSSTQAFADSYSNLYIS